MVVARVSRLLADAKDRIELVRLNPPDGQERGLTNNENVAPRFTKKREVYSEVSGKNTWRGLIYLMSKLAKALVLSFCSLSNR